LLGAAVLYIGWRSRPSVGVRGSCLRRLPVKEIPERVELPFDLLGDLRVSSSLVRQHLREIGDEIAAVPFVTFLELVAPRSDSFNNKLLWNGHLVAS
jgi:hypothetical protein